jgi:hypothetical protein
MQDFPISLVGGPLDGWPLIIRGELPDELRLPYSREMLELAGQSTGPDSAALRERWLSITFPSEADAAGIALYRRELEANPPRYQFAGHADPR